MQLYHWLLTPISLAWAMKGAPPTSWMEIIAVIFTILSVFAATKLKISQYPVGIIGTIFYSFVFLDAKLYSSLTLNIYFTVIQLYGWYFWMYGGKNDLHLTNGMILRPPPIGNWSWKVVGLWGLVASAISVGVGYLVARFLHGSNAFLDAAILALSVLAQFLLDRKQIKSWFVWMAVNVLSVIVYGGQKLVVSEVLYVALFFNAIYGYWNWLKEDQEAKEYAERYTPSHDGPVMRI